MCDFSNSTSRRAATQAHSVRTFCFNGTPPRGQRIFFARQIASHASNTSGINERASDTVVIAGTKKVRARPFSENNISSGEVVSKINWAIRAVSTNLAVYNPPANKLTSTPSPPPPSSNALNKRDAVTKTPIKNVGMVIARLLILCPDKINVAKVAATLAKIPTPQVAVVFCTSNDSTTRSNIFKSGGSLCKIVLPALYAKICCIVSLLFLII